MSSDPNLPPVPGTNPPPQPAAHTIQVLDHQGNVLHSITGNAADALADIFVRFVDALRKAFSDKDAS